MTGKAIFDPAAFRGQVALITGAGGGIGSTVARRFAALGVRLALTDLRPEPLRAVAAGLGDAEVVEWTGDLTSEPAVKELFAQILERYGRIDIAINAAGVLRTTPFESITMPEWNMVMGANAGSAFLVCRECCEPMRHQGYGRIVNFSSVAATVGGILSGAHYAASKAAVTSLTRSVAKLLAPYGVRCNVISPSGVDTEMLHQFTEEQRETLREGIPVKRFGTPEEIAELVLWLSSPVCDYITGQTIHINGGTYLG